MLALEDKAAAFAGMGGDGDSDVLVVPGWGTEEWAKLFSYASEVALRPGATLIRQHDADRTLYFLVSGALEAAISYGEQAMAPLRRLRPGSVVGELAFFDGKPRSAHVWATQESALMRLEFAAYSDFAAANTQRANELLFGLGRLVAWRLRFTTTQATRRL